MRFPFPSNKVTGHFGTLSEYRRKNGLQPHSGTDWAMPEGTPIPAIAKGTIKLIQWSKVLGWVVVQTAMDKEGKIWYLGY
jgi:murein DD-endopeptidase MepM/ murein hydrolase activator NlpD